MFLRSVHGSLKPFSSRFGDIPPFPNNGWTAPESLGRAQYLCQIKPVLNAHSRAPTIVRPRVAVETGERNHEKRHHRDGRLRVYEFGSASAQAQGQGTVGNGPKAPCTIEEYTGVKQEFAAARAYIKALPDLCKPDKDGNVRVISGTPGQRGTDGKPGAQGRDGSDGKSPRSR